MKASAAARTWLFNNSPERSDGARVSRSENFYKVAFHRRLRLGIGKVNTSSLITDEACSWCRCALRNGSRARSGLVCIKNSRKTRLHHRKSLRRSEAAEIYGKCCKVIDRSKSKREQREGSRFPALPDLRRNFVDFEEDEAKFRCDRRD